MMVQLVRDGTLLVWTLVTPERGLGHIRNFFQNPARAENEFYGVWQKNNFSVPNLPDIYSRAERRRQSSLEASKEDSVSETSLIRK